jgi:hypothetical protein
MTQLAADLPPFAYVPGKTPRHLEGAFDDIRNTVKSDMSIAALEQSLAFQTGLAFLKAEYFWEAHEVLEPVWMVLPPNSNERRFVQGLIQLGNARLKVKMGKTQAATRLFAIAAEHLGSMQQDRVLGQTVEYFRCQAKAQH